MTNSDYQNYRTFIYASWGIYFNIHRSYYTYISLSPFHQIIFFSLYIDNPQSNSPYNPMQEVWQCSHERP